MVQRMSCFEAMLPRTTLVGTLEKPWRKSHLKDRLHFVSRHGHLSPTRLCDMNGHLLLCSEACWAMRYGSFPPVPYEDASPCGIFLP